MKISIDTKEDSPEEIRKLIRMLLALVGDADYSSQRAPPSSGEGLFDMFGDPAASTSQQQQLGGGRDINDFTDKPDSQSSGRQGSDDEDELKVVPY